MANSSKGPDERLHKLEQEINRVSAMAAEALVKAKAAGFQALEGFVSKQDAAREKMRGVGSAGGDAWKELKVGLDTAWSDLHGAVQSAITTFQERQRRESHSTSQPSHDGRASAKPPKKKKAARKKSSQRSSKSPVASARRRSSKRST